MGLGTVLDRRNEIKLDIKNAGFNFTDITETLGRDYTPYCNAFNKVRTHKTLDKYDTEIKDALKQLKLLTEEE